MNTKPIKTSATRWEYNNTTIVKRKDVDRKTKYFFEINGTTRSRRTLDSVVNEINASNQ